MMVSVSLLALIFAGLAMVLGQTNRAVRTGTSVMDLEARGSRAMQRMVAALRAADMANLGAVPAAPLSASSVTFQRNLGYDGTQTVLSAPCEIGVDANGSIVFTEDVGLPGERAVPWVRGTAALLEGEVLNVADDNGNGLNDEPGLCFTLDGRLLTIRFTLEDRTPEGVPLTRTWMTRVLCRN
jgi:hypothetical protein